MNEIIPHPGSQGTKDYIANWIAPDFFYSKADVWHRFGFLGVFGDYVLSCTQGDILEVGVGESSIYLSHLARKYNRKIFHCDIAPSKIINPLTIPGYLTPEAVNVDGKEKSIQIDNSFFFMGPSDDFFNMGIPPLALSFIDGDHVYNQARKDFLNAISRTVDNGYVCLHDTYPPNKEFLAESACGDVYKLRQQIEADPRFDCITLVKGTAMGVGLSVVRKKPKELEEFNQ